MPYVKAQPCVDCDHLADLIIRRGGEDYYDTADRLAEQLKLKPREKLRLKSNLQRMLEGSYLVRQP